MNKNRNIKRKYILFSKYKIIFLFWQMVILVIFQTRDPLRLIQWSRLGWYFHIQYASFADWKKNVSLEKNPKFVFKDGGHLVNCYKNIKCLFTSVSAIWAFNSQNAAFKLESYWQNTVVTDIIFIWKSLSLLTTAVGL